MPVASSPTPSPADSPLLGGPRPSFRLHHDPCRWDLRTCRLFTARTTLAAIVQPDLRTEPPPRVEPVCGQRARVVSCERRGERCRWPSQAAHNTTATAVAARPRASPLPHGTRYAAHAKHCGGSESFCDDGCTPATAAPMANTPSPATASLALSGTDGEESLAVVSLEHVSQYLEPMAACGVEGLRTPSGDGGLGYSVDPSGLSSSILIGHLRGSSVGMWVPPIAPLSVGVRGTSWMVSRTSSLARAAAVGA